MSSRYQINDQALKSSKKKFHVVDLTTGKEVFHTDSRSRAEEVVRLAGDGPITGHLKDKGHAEEPVYENGRLVASCRCYADRRAARR